MQVTQHADVLADLRAEHAATGVGPNLWTLLSRVVWSTAPTYPASEYSPDWVWTEQALEDVRQDWIESRLIGRGDLALMLASARTSGGLRALLVRSLRQHLINARRRTSATNLYTRLLKRLAESDRVHLVTDPGTPPQRGWALNPLLTEPAAGDVIEILSATARLTSDEDWGVVRYGPASLKSSPILRTPQLDAFIIRMLGAADGYVTTSELFAVLTNRFGLANPRSDWHAATDATNPATVDDEVANHLVAISVVARLSVDELTILRALDDQQNDFTRAADELSVPLSDVEKALEHKCYLIAEYAESYEEAADIARRVDESLYVRK